MCNHMYILQATEINWGNTQGFKNKIGTRNRTRDKVEVRNRDIKIRYGQEK